MNFSEWSDKLRPKIEGGAATSSFSDWSNRRQDTGNGGQQNAGSGQSFTDWSNQQADRSDVRRIFSDINDYSDGLTRDFQNRSGTYQTQEALEQYQTRANAQGEQLLSRLRSVRDYYKGNRAKIEETYGKGSADLILSALDEYENYLTTVRKDLESEKSYWAQFDSEDAFKSWQKLQSYAEIPNRPDYGEKSRYVSTYQPGTERFNAWTGTYTDTGFGDMLYDYINGNETARERQALNDVGAGGPGSIYATTHSGWADLPQETVGIFNYIYATEGPEAAYAYLDATTDKGRTGIENIALGALKGSGLSSVSAALMSLGSPEAAKEYQSWIDREAARSAAERPGLYAAGAVGGTLMMMMGISKGIGAIKGLSSLPALAQSVISGAGSFGGIAALQGAGAAATGNITPGEYLKNVGVSALAGGAGGALNAGIAQLGGAALTKLGLTQNTLARTVVAGLSGAGFAAGRTGVEELAKYLEYPEDYKPDDAQIAQDLLVAFAFSALSYLASAGPGAQQPAPEKKYSSEFFNENMTEEEARQVYRDLSKQYHPDLHPGDAEAAAKMAQINADYDALQKIFTARHVASATEAYRTATTSTGAEAQAAAETYAAEVAYLTEISRGGALATTEAAEAVQILQAAQAGLAGGAAAAAAGNLPATQPQPELPKAPAEAEPLTLPSLEGTTDGTPGENVPGLAALPETQNAVPGPETASGGGTVRYSFRDVPVPTYEQLIEKPDIPVVDIRRTRSGSFAAERDAFLNSERAQQLYVAPVLNRDTGESMFITPGTIKHTFSNLGWEQIELAEHLPEIIENAVLTHAEPSRKAPGDHTTGVYTLFGAAQTAEGVQPVKLTVKEYSIEGQDLPATIQEYLGTGIQPETYASVYDGKVLVLEGIEKEGPSSSAITGAAPGAAVNYPSGPSEISVKDLLALVKGDAIKYIPQPPAPAAPIIENGGMTDGREGAGGPEPAQAGGSEASQAAGRSLYDGDGGRRGPERLGGRAERVPEEVRTKAQDRRHGQLARQRQQAVTDEPIQSPADIGVPYGAEAQILKVVPEWAWDDEIRSAVEWARGMGVKEVVPVVGLLQVEQDGITATPSGVIDTRTGRIFIRADSAKSSFSETVEHEVAHWKADEQKVSAFMELVKSRYKPEAWQPVYDAYKRTYADLTNNYAGMTERQIELYVWEEILGDAYSNKNRYSVKAGVYGGEADAVLGGTAPEETAQGAGDIALPAGVQRGAAGIRGPPERYSYGGRNANRADNEALAEAERLEMQGLDPEDIRRETGWFRGADGLWRFEIDDSGMEYRRQGDMQYMEDPEYREYLELWDKVVARTEGSEEELERLRELDKRYSGVGRVSTFKLYEGRAKLSDIIRHDELFRNYPQLRNTGVRFADLPDGIRGEYNLTRNTITLDNTLRNAPENTLIHEIQHAIQRAEGFARGASTEYWQDRLNGGYDNRTPAELREAERLQKQYDILAAEDPEFIREMEELNASAPDIPRGEFDPETFELIGEEPREWQLFDQRRDELAEKYGELKVFDFFHLREQLDRHVAGSGNRTAYDLYRDTAGEIEARDAARRRTMTPEQRRATRPETGGENAVFAENPEESYAAETGEAPVGQAITSAKTSIKQVPALFKDKNVRFGATNIDIGGGRFDLATDFLRERGTENMVFGPYNRTAEENERTLRFLQSGERADTATCANVLNVIAEPNARANVILEAAKSIKPDGTAYFMVYEGDGSGQGKETSAGWQNNRKTADYVGEIGRYFQDVQRKGKLIIARNPDTDLPKASWETQPGRAVRYSMDEEDSTGKALTPAQREYFKDSAIRDEQGRLREVYHGTNSGEFTVFDWDKTQSTDGGWFGRGFYFTFWKGEARTYGARVLDAYLNIKNPFVFRDELLEYGDMHPEDTDATSLAFMINFAEKFPELAEGRTLEVVTGWDEDGYGITKEIPWSELRSEIEGFMARPDFRIMEIMDSNNGNADGLKYEYVVKNGPGEWDYAYSYPYMSREEAERDRFGAAVQMLFRRGVYHSADFHMPHTYIEDIGTEFSEALKQRGYDGVLQTREGDEIVAFYPEQIKRSDNKNPTANPDVRYAVDGDGPEEYNAIMERDDVALGEEDQTYTETDRPVDFTWAIVPAESLIVSNDQHGNANPDYPAELQPRDRSRAASQEQIQKMSRGLIPRKLAESPTAQNGAPIIRGDGVVIGGNARSAAILAAYRNGMAGEYEAFLRERGSKYGIDTTALPEKPVLVRIAKGADDWAALAQDLNVSSTAAYSATETAMTDAKKMDGILELLIPNDEGDINTADNSDFITAFISRVVPASERGGLVTASGLLSQAGLERAENAVFAYAYGDPDLMAKYSEALDNDMKNVTNALMQSAPAAVALRAAVEAGNAYDVAAVQTVLKGLELYGEAKRLKKTVAEHVAQLDLLEGDNWPAAFIAGFIERNKRSAKQLRTMFLSLYNEVEDYGDPNQQSLFGGEDHDIREALNGAIRRYEQETGREIERPDFWRVGGDEGLAGGNGAAVAPEPDADYGVPAESGPENPGADGGGLPESEPAELSLPSLEPEASETVRDLPGEPTEMPVAEPELSEPVRNAPTQEKQQLPELEERPAPKKERKPPRRKPPAPIKSTLPESGIPEGYSSIEEFVASSEARAAAAKAERLRNVSKEDFAGTKALQKLGVKIENSVGIYSHIDQLIAGDRAAKQIQRETRKAERRLGATEAERNFASGIAAGVYTAGDIPASMNAEKVMELADYYFAEQAVAADRIRQQRAEIGRVLDEKMEELFKDSDDFKPSRAIVLNYRTPARNMLHIFGDERGRAINEAIFGPVAVNEAERFRFVNRMHDAVRTFAGKDGKPKKLAKEERAVVQQVIEGRAAAEMVAGMEMRGAIESAAHNIRNGRDAGDEAKEFGLSREEEKLAIRYARWLETEEAMRSGKVDAVKVEAAAKKYSELFNQFYDAINDFLVAHGYEPIGFIKGYAPHIQPEENHNLLNKAFGALGINTDVTRLPSSIAGLTANYRPNKRWNPYFLQRTSDVTQFDIASAFESYVDYMSDVLYHTDDIMRVRAATRYFRQTYAPEEIKNNLSWASELRYGTTEEKANYLRDQGVIDKATALTPADVDAQMDEYVEKLFGDITKTTKYSDLVTWLDNYANILAGKQSMADRSPESMFGREVLNFGNKLIRIFSQANVAGNLSSMFNQTAQIPMIHAELGSRWTAAAIKDIITGQLRRGEWAGGSDFLTGKKGIEYLVSTPGEMVITAMFKPLEFMDTFVSTVAVRGKYLKELHAGKSHKEAMRAADAFGTAVMGSRMKGSKPLAFSSKNPIYQMVNIFQIEAFNSWEHIKEDLPRDFRTIEKEQGKAKAARALAGVLVKGLLLAFIMNRLAEKLYGGTPAPFDLLGLTANFIASGEGLTTNAYLETLIDNALEKVSGERLFGTKDEIGEEPFNWEQALEDLGYNVSNDIPFFRNVAGLLGWGDETLPMPDLYGTGKDLVESLKKNGVSWDSGRSLLALLAQLVPGGRQLYKTALGAETIARGGDFSGTGDNEKLKYPTDGDFWSTVQALVFGKYSAEASDAYYAGSETALSAKQTKLWRSLTEGGADPRAVYDAIQDYRKISNDDSLSSYDKGVQERALIDGLDMTDAQKLEMYRSMTNADSRADKFQAIMDTGLNFGQVMSIYDKYAEIDAEENMKASEQATAFAKWVDEQGYKDSQAEVIKEQLKFWQIIPAEANRYEKLTDAGLESEDAGDLTSALAALQPEQGKETVSNMQKYRLIASWDLSDAEKIAAIGTVMGTDMTTEAGNPSAYAKMLGLLDGGVTLEQYLDLNEAGAVDGYVKYQTVNAGRNYGIAPETYLDFRERLPGYDADGNGSYTQEEVRNALDSMGGGEGLSLPTLDGGASGTLTNTQKAVLWQLYNKSWKPGKNPYDTTVGQWVYDALHAEPAPGGLPSLTGTDEPQGLSLPSLAG